MFDFVADLVRGWGMPWNAIAFGIILGLFLFIAGRIILYVLLYLSYILVSSVRLAKLAPPAAIYVLEYFVDELRNRLLLFLFVWLVILGGWLWLFSERDTLKAQSLIGLERRMTGIAYSWIASEGALTTPPREEKLTRPRR